MKSIFILLVFLVSIQLGYAQTDSVTVEYSTDSVASKDYDTGRKYKYLDRNFIEEKQVTRLYLRLNNYRNIDQFFNYGSVDQFLNFEHERKIGLSSSISAGMDSYTLSKYGFVTAHGFNASYKYFYSSKKKIEAGQKANNLNGTFISARYTYINKDLVQNYNNNTQIISLKWGVQQRLGRFGFFEMNTGINFTPFRQESIYDRDQNSFELKTNWFNFNSQFKIGLAIGSLARNNKNTTPYIDQLNSKIRKITNQMTEDKSFFKIGIQDFKLDAISYTFHFLFAYEQKLKPALSIIAETDYALGSRYNSKPYSNFLTHSGFRYYYSLQKRMERGIGANNFSANYISLMAIDLIKKQNSYGYYKSVNEYFSDPGIGAYWGMQRKIGKFGFVDFKIGMKYKENNNLTANGDLKYEYEFQPEFRLIYGIGR